ncbi:omega-amidase NIT2-like [Ixodes scapularis]|uniref:omega-amidase NIT2-like n=1 Tax=Ixodes scapularis TaxID=6945 RepID=UPI001A9DD205|nr:omega-amidase NIT2-like [Ixodes scapularis]
MATNKFRLALLQLAPTLNKSETLRATSLNIKKAATSGAHMVCLPACFGYPLGGRGFKASAETIPGETSEMLSQCARENGVYLIGGSMTEIDGKGQRYNTCLVYGPDGSMVAKHRKLHLFDADIPGMITSRESSLVSPGNRLTTFDTPLCKVGVGVCYDIFFAPLAHIYSQLGCKLLVFPSAFTVDIGPIYAELYSRSRAVDGQVYVALASLARSERTPYVPWGHSMLVDPMGKVVRSAGTEEEILMSEVDLDYLSTVRKQMPIMKHHRNDLYDVIRVAGDHFSGHGDGDCGAT